MYYDYNFYAITYNNFLNYHKLVNRDFLMIKNEPYIRNKNFKAKS
jgi:hypothetical protein